jgi:hypothetical protein
VETTLSAPAAPTAKRRNRKKKQKTPVRLVTDKKDIQSKAEAVAWYKAEFQKFMAAHMVKGQPPAMFIRYQRTQEPPTVVYLPEGGFTPPSVQQTVDASGQAVSVATEMVVPEGVRTPDTWFMSPQGDTYLVYFGARKPRATIICWVDEGKSYIGWSRCFNTKKKHDQWNKHIGRMKAIEAGHPLVSAEGIFQFEQIMLYEQDDTMFFDALLLVSQLADKGLLPDVTPAMIVEAMQQNVSIVEAAPEVPKTVDLASVQ